MSVNGFNFYPLLAAVWTSALLMLALIAFVQNILVAARAL